MLDIGFSTPDITAFYRPHPNPPPSMGRVLGDYSFFFAD
jgi:hypothetical protein